MKILDLEELAALLGRRPETIKKDIRRNPCAVPPRLLHIPGTRLLRWRDVDVQAWLAEHVVGGDCLRKDGWCVKAVGSFETQD
ncbi:hypothetical protein JJQ59_04700 [Cupriavidus necator]|uniref:hypothetical protein n=1 Tax=Cupriavidus necator TaxID=106590 RepID=UPI0019282156|nr:hypothetical protein [Cupriavidus necator]QQX86288.1 hypothetical protein JJQ59_04700 [Cupriavidus necator]